jgi:hypothetical protein
MEDLEQQLKNALARTDAPEWFEAKVMAAVRRDDGMPARRHALRWRWASALLATVLVVGGVTWQYERAVQERAAGEGAKARLELALKITRAKLQKIEQKLNEVERDN